VCETGHSFPTCFTPCSLSEHVGFVHVTVKPSSKDAAETASALTSGRGRNALAGLVACSARPDEPGLNHGAHFAWRARGWGSSALIVLMLLSPLIHR